jgi:CPA1 family monovalent cation:H+ antiporter
MAGLELVLVLLVAAAALQVVARRWHLPHPVLLVLGGALLAISPGLPHVSLDPEIVFVVFVPPLLYWTAYTTSLRDVRREFWPIMRLGVLLVLVTIVASAGAAHALTPAFTWPAAFVLGAIVSPPDPVAATAVMRPLGAPSRLVSILEGEGLVNDATALVAYRVAVAAAVTGHFSPVHAGLGILAAGIGGVAIGLVVGWAVTSVRGYLRHLPIVSNTVSLLTPFAAYLPADRLGASGVLAVVAVGLRVARRGPRLLPAATRVQAEAMWTMIAFLLESLIFILIGLDLPFALRALRRHSLEQLLWYGLAISAVLVGVRLLWVFPSAYLPRLLTRLTRADGTRSRPLPSWRWVLFVGLAGVRGGDSLVIALALPRTTAAHAAFPARDLIVFVTFAVIFVTLVVQGLSLRPLIHVLRLRDDGQADAEEAHARRVVSEAALRRLDELAHADAAPDPSTVREIRRRHEQNLRRWSARDLAHHGAHDDEHRALADTDGAGVERDSERARALRLEALAAERRALVDLRDRGVIGDDVLRRIQRDLDLETMLIEAADDDAPESPYGL